MLEGFEYVKRGGIIDLAYGIYDKLSPRKVIKKAQNQNIPLENILVSCDVYRSFSNYGKYGNLLEIGVSSVDSLLLELNKMVNGESIALEEALMFFYPKSCKGLKLIPT